MRPGIAQGLRVEHLAHRDPARDGGHHRNARQGDLCKVRCNPQSPVGPCSSNSSAYPVLAPRVAILCRARLERSGWGAGTSEQAARKEHCNRALEGVGAVELPFVALQARRSVRSVIFQAEEGGCLIPGGSIVASRFGPRDGSCPSEAFRAYGPLASRGARPDHPHGGAPRLHASRGRGAGPKLLSEAQPRAAERGHRPRLWPPALPRPGERLRLSEASQPGSPHTLHLVGSSLHRLCCPTCPS